MRANATPPRDQDALNNWLTLLRQDVYNFINSFGYGFELRTVTVNNDSEFPLVAKGFTARGAVPVTSQNLLFTMSTRQAGDTLFVKVQLDGVASAEITFLLVGTK